MKRPAILAPFTRNLLDWYDPNARQLPWKAEPDPYRIWISEVILQQTRAEQGKKYYARFLERFPNLETLALAQEDAILKAWEGLGYYSRARNLHQAARQILEIHRGRFPETYEAIRSLKGVGDYTAAAIASFAFRLPHAVLDGNVYRVLSRYFGTATPIDTPAGKKEFALLANQLLDKDDPGTFNQAIMDLGATICTPAVPDCASCPLATACVAFQQGNPKDYPIKANKGTIKEVYLHYLVVQAKQGLWIRKRNSKGIWKGLYEFPSEELGSFQSWSKLKKNAFYPGFDRNDFHLDRMVGLFTQKLTHRTVFARYFLVKPVHHQARALPDGCLAAEAKNLRTFTFPKIIHQFLQSEQPSYDQ